jgi:hypothetical protein
MYVVKVNTLLYVLFVLIVVVLFKILFDCFNLLLMVHEMQGCHSLEEIHLLFVA